MLRLKTEPDDIPEEQRLFHQPDRPFAQVAHRALLDTLVAAAFPDRDEESIVGDLDRALIAWARQRTMAEFASHPQLAARNRWRTVHTPRGDVEALLPPVTASVDASSWEPPTSDVPEVGQHTAAILDWLGLAP